MSDTPNTPTGETRNFAVQLLVLNFIYLCLVFAWTLPFSPLARDYDVLAQPHILQPPGNWVFALETAVFGDFYPAYRLVNLLLLYGCMVAIFFLTRWTVRGPWWLGSLAAVMTMANPVKSEAALGLAGVEYLFPALLAFIALAVYAHRMQTDSWRSHSIALLFFLGAATSLVVGPSLLLAVIFLDVFFAKRRDGRFRRLAPFFGATLVSIVVQVPMRVVQLYALHDSVGSPSIQGLPCFWPESWNVGGMFVPLWLVVYPIGFLPSTAAHIQPSWRHGTPDLGVVLALATVCLVLLLAWRMKHPAFRFGVLAALAVRLGQGFIDVDLVRMDNGGVLLVPLALLSIAFAALCHRVMRHPKWPRPVVILTTVLCVVLFFLQARNNLAVWHAAREPVAMDEQHSFPSMNNVPLDKSVIGRKNGAG